LAKDRHIQNGFKNSKNGQKETEFLFTSEILKFRKIVNYSTIGQN
jgi:hypothetical protein